MKSILLFAYLCFPLFLNAQELSPVDQQGAVKFVINNFGSGVEGSFSGLKGKISFQPAKPGEADFSVSINATSIETGINMRNRHLKGEKYFHAEKFPLITIESSSVKSAGSPYSYLMMAKLTIKGITRNISIPFTAKPQKDGFLFEGSFTINRRDFGIGGGSLSLADDVKLRLKVLAKQ